MPPRTRPVSELTPETRGGRVARHGLLSMVALVVLGGTRVIYGATVSRVVTHETFGAIGVLLAIAMIASYVLPAGIASATSRFLPFSRGRGDEALVQGFHRLLSRSASVSAPLLGLGAAALVLWPLQRSTEEAIETGLLTAAYSLYTTEKAGLYGFGAVAAYVRLEILASALVLAATIVVVLIKGWFLLPFVLGYAIFVAGARRAIRRELHEPIVMPNAAARRELLAYVALACAGTVASAGFLQGTQLMAARFATTSDVAYFAAIVTLIAPLYFLPRSLALALFPSMSEAHGAGELDVIRRHTDISTRGLLVILAPVIVVAEILAAEILIVFGGSSYAAGAPVLQLMLIAAFVAVVQVAAVNALSSGPNGQLRVPVGWAVAGCLMGLGIVALIGGSMGAIGVSVAYLAGTIVTAGGPIIVVWRRYRMTWSGPVIRASALVVLAALAAGVIDGVALAAGTAWLVHGLVAVAASLVALVVLRSDLAAILTATRPQWNGMIARLTGGPGGMDASREPGLDGPRAEVD